VLEKHWNGSLLDSLDAVVGHAQTMTYNGRSPVVTIVNRVYQTGVHLTAALMAEIEMQISRFEVLGRWFIDIGCSQLRGAVT